MKQIFSRGIYVIMISLVVGNIVSFCSSMSVGSEISAFEKNIKKFQSENAELEQKLSDVQSLKYAKEAAGVLSFTEVSQPLFLRTLPYAQNTRIN